MPEELIVEQCSPTLAGIKTASMFSCGIDSRKQILDEIRQHNRALRHKGIRFLPLRIRDGKALIYCFRPERLRRDLSDKEAASILIKQGYRPSGTASLIRQLIRRMSSAGPGEFPHEVGLFLGYPPSDVRGFMEKGAAGSSETGFWQAYGNVEEARKIWNSYRRCTEIYLDRFANGAVVPDLAVASNT